jgi:hypothetical protein
MAFPHPFETTTSRPSPGLIGPGSYARVSSPLRSAFASPPGRSSSERPLLPGFHPSSRHHRRSPRSRKLPRSRFVPPSGFRNLSAACSTIGFAGLFHPAATSRVLPSRGFSRPAAVPTRRRAMPPCRCDAQTHRRPGCHCAPLDFEALFCGPERSLGSGFSLPFGRSPLRLPPPAGSSSTTVPRLPGASARDVAAVVFISLPCGIKTLASSGRLQRLAGSFTDAPVAGSIHLCEVSSLPSRPPS